MAISKHCCNIPFYNNFWRKSDEPWLCADHATMFSRYVDIGGQLWDVLLRFSCQAQTKEFLLT